MILKDLIGNYTTEEIIGNINIEINGISHNSKDLDKRYIFVAIKGFTVDGHKFVKEAIEKGAVCIIIEDDVKIFEDITCIKVKDSSDALAYLSTRFYQNPISRLIGIGITGTNGKTSTSYYLKGILDKNGIKSGVIGTLEGKNTTPDSLELNRRIHDMVLNKKSACIMEVSSHALELKRVEYMNFDIGIFTNISQDHLDFHLNMDDYFKAKTKLFLKTRRFNIINIDDKYGRELIKILRKSNKTPIFTYGINSKSDIYASNIVYNIDRVSFDLTYGACRNRINLGIPGRFSVYNALAAAACAICLNMNMKEIKAGLEDLTNIPGRFERISVNRNFSVIIDFAHTPEGLENVLQTINGFSEGRIIVVFGAGGNRDRKKRPLMGEIAGKYADLSILTSDNPRWENPSDIIKDIEVGIRASGGIYKIVEDRKEAIEYALNEAGPKDIVLIAGKGHETYIIIGNDIFPFDERKIITEHLKES